MSETTVSERRLAEHGTDFDRFVAKGELQPVYQPIVDLIAGGVVGFEALARWPNCTDATPDVVFAAARTNGRNGELEWGALAALAGAISSDLVGSSPLRQVEPDIWERPSASG